MLTRPGGEPAALRSAVLVGAALAVLNVVRHVSTSGGVALSAAAATALLVFGRRAGLSWDELGLGAGRLRAGGAWALAAVLLVAGAYLVGVLVPATRGAFLDTRYAMPLPDALSTALVVIPLGTVLVEEVAFRSVLWGLLADHAGHRQATVVTAVMFGLWHVLPSLDFAGGHPAVSVAGPRRDVLTTVLVALGTVAFTALGGLVAGELRRRSGSLLASAGMHWATNGLGVLFGLAAWRLHRREGQVLAQET